MLQKTTIDFLKLLKKNNNKPWFDENRKKYEAAKANFEEIVLACIEHLSKHDSDYGLLKPKECMFRINRDVRFSNDKSPYKTNFGAAFSLGGKKGNLAGYYLHIEPTTSFIGAGIWMPEADTLKKIRQEIDYNFKEFNTIIENKKFKQQFGELSQENKLAKAPKGYEVDNPAIEILKLKSFTVGHSFSETEILHPTFIKEINAYFNTLHAFISFLNKAVQPDL